MFKQSQGHKRSKLVNILFVFVLLSVMIGNMPSQAASSAQEPPPFETVDLSSDTLKIDFESIQKNPRESKNTKLDSTMAQLASATSLAEQKALIATSALKTSGKRVHVQIVTHADGLQVAIEAVNKAGGEMTKTSKQEDLIQGWLPIDALEAVAAHEDVFFIRRPAEAILLDETRVDAQITEGLAAINGEAWHQAGYTGAGVKIAVIDGGFIGFADLLGTDLPLEVWVESFVDGEDYLDVGGTTEHGTACAEIIHDIAPEAYLYLLKMGTDLDLEQAVDWIIAEAPDIDIISTSLGFFNITPGDGTGKFEELVQQAHDAGILWITAAGNQRQAHWGGPFDNPSYTPDTDNTHYYSLTQNVNYYGLGDEDNAYIISEGYPISVFLRWDDWTSLTQDYDLYMVYLNSASQWIEVARSDDPQTGALGQKPTEWIRYVTEQEGVYGFVINRVNSNRNVNLEVFAPNVAPRLEYFEQARSLDNLADAPSAITVAALDMTTPYPQEDYSAEGPTNGPGGTANGGIIKPDISAFANVSTVSYGIDEKFNGTSSATPHVAGAAALVLSAFPTISPTDIREFLETNAVDMGATGKDNNFGYGRLYLGDAPSPPTPPAIPNANDGVLATAVQPDGKILIGGYFTQVNEEARNHIARLNPDGSLDENFNPDINSRVDTIAVQPDGKILVGGAFSMVGSYGRNSIARLNYNGTVDTTFNPIANNTVYAITLQTDGKILVGGAFTTIDSESHMRIARLEANGAVDDTFNTNLNDIVRTIVVQQDENILVGGAFDEVNSKKQASLARLNQNGSMDEDFTPIFNNYVAALLLRPDGTMLVGGEFTEVNSETYDHIMWLDVDGTVYEKTTFPDVNGDVLSIGLQADGKILLGGYFTQVGSATHNRIVRLAWEGGVDNSIYLDADDLVASIGLQKSGTIILGGQFTSVNSETQNKVAFLSNNIYALQDLSAGYSGPTGDRITWRLRNSSPEVYRVTFEISTNGTHYFMLGNASYSQGNWVMGNLSLPKEQDIWIRARGFYSSGRFNGSGSILESVLKTRLENQAPTNIDLSDNFIEENQPVNTVVGAFSTSDPDPDDTFTYKLVSGTGAFHNNLFNISGSDLRTSAVFDYEAIKGYSIRVRSMDQDGLYVERPFTILVLDVEDGETEGSLIYLPLLLK